MSDVKAKLLEEINQKIEKRRQAKKRAAQNNTVEAYVLDLIKNIEEIAPMVTNDIEWQLLAKQAVNSFEQRMKSIDPTCNVFVNWHESDGKPPQIYNVNIKWSKYYVNKENCDQELTVDATELLFM